MLTEIPADHGRTLRVGQVWRSNNPRTLSGVRIKALLFFHVYVEDLLTGLPRYMLTSRFTIGPEGYSLEKEA